MINRKNILGLIPARGGSKGVPKKNIKDLMGKPLIEYTAEAAKKSKYIDHLIVSTDSEEIAEIVPSRMTIDADNGTERCAQKAIELGWDYFINVQGDMPDITTEIIVELAKNCKDHHVLTAYTDMNSVDRANPDSVKLIHNGSKAKWFCRASLDYGDHHLGVYAYSRVALLEYPNLVKTKEEEIEKLEQLRWLQNNIDIGIVKVDFNGIEINTPEDLEKWHKQNSH